ncbi:hypothetical protein BscR1v2_008910 [Bartonella schoenbuchensis R1]|uniref:Right handed beta helix region n=2 Tax=Bartonella schoenbuchensis TaxID=165694 RepID=A0A1S6XR40_BARSR|nr:hypothetical protein BscR1v2_008910 [Bartonella schoenbuchensis R1]
MRVMRRVLNNHICSCILSTALLAALAHCLYPKNAVAQSQNCTGDVQGNGGTDRPGEPIVCESGSKFLKGPREIDMGKVSDEGQEAAVTVKGQGAIITIESLTVNGEGADANKPAVKVKKGTLVLEGVLNISDVKTAVEIDGKGSTVMLLGETGRKSITIKEGGHGFKVKGGNLSLKGKTEITGVGSGGVESTGMEISNGGMVYVEEGVTFDKVTTAIRIARGSGEASISGRGSMNVTGEGIAIQVEGGGKASVTLKTITGDNKGTGMVVSGSGDLTLNDVTMTGMKTAMQVVSGTASVMGETQITVRGGNGIGVKVERSGTLNMMGETMIMVTGTGGVGVKVGEGTVNATLTNTRITVVENGTGVKVGEGTVIMKQGSITGDRTGTGVQMMGGNVTLEGVNISSFMKGIEATKGTLKVKGGTQITVADGGTGINMTGGTLNMNQGTITVKGGGIGVNVGDR